MCGKIQDQHRYSLDELLANLEFAEGKIVHLDPELLCGIEPSQELMQRLSSIPGVDVLASWTLIAERGPDITVFPDATHPESWAACAPEI